LNPKITGRVRDVGTLGSEHDSALELLPLPPASSFYFKGKLWPRSHGTPQITIADIAKTLGVAYVLDGSVRKSGTPLRVDARLIRAENGFVVWSETYDRPFDDILMVQDDIADEVTKALKASIEARPN
jgi:TolB-like protein